MRKLTLPLLFLALIASACGSAAPVAAPGASAPPASSPSSADMPCLVVNQASAGGTQEPGLLAQFGDRAHAIGPVDAPVTIVVFSDFQCTSCAFEAAILEQIRTNHPDDVRLVFVPFPVASEDKSALALQAAEAADLQGKFWEMHDLLFAQQSAWTALSAAAFPAWVQQQAAGLGMDPARFLADFNGSVVAARVHAAVASTASIQHSLPILFINSSTPYSGRVDLAGLDQVVSLLALSRRQASSCPPMIVQASRQYIATLQTVRGTIVAELFADKAPLAVNDFVFLAKAGWYDGNTFFKVVPGQLAESGDPSGTGFGNAGYFFETEIAPGLKFDKPGMLALANNGVNTNSSQFLITEAPLPEMDGQYTIFGQVISGLDVLGQLTARNPAPGQVAAAGDTLQSVTITEH